MRAGLIGEATCTDISPGMLATLSANAERLGPRRDDGAHRRRAPALRGRELRPGDRPRDPAPHPRPGPGVPRVRARARARRHGAVRRRALALRRPLGESAQACRRRRRAAVAAGDPRPPRPACRRRRAGGVAGGRSSTCTPSPPASSRASRATRASQDIRVTGEELLANWFGWTNRTLEATAHPEDVPWGWRNYAYRGYLALQGVDRRLLESRLPAAMFYNLIVTASKP